MTSAASIGGSPAPRTSGFMLPPGLPPTGGEGTYVLLVEGVFQYWVFEKRRDAPGRWRRLAPAEAASDLQRRIGQRSLFVPYLATAGFLALCLAPALEPWAWLLVVTLLVAGAVPVFLWGRQRSVAILHYNTTDPALVDRLTLVDNAVGVLSRCNGLWQVGRASFVRDVKYTAGASTLLNRWPLRVGSPENRQLRINVPISSVRAAQQEAFFLPDQLLLVSGGAVRVIPYEHLNVSASVTRFVEYGLVPRDAQVVDRTWQYVRRDGGPDLRFRDNRQLPVALYGVLELAAGGVPVLSLQTSVVESADRCASVLRTLAARSATAIHSPPLAPVAAFRSPAPVPAPAPLPPPRALPGAPPPPERAAPPPPPPPPPRPSAALGNPRPGAAPVPSEPPAAPRALPAPPEWDDSLAEIVVEAEGPRASYRISYEQIQSQPPSAAPERRAAVRDAPGARWVSLGETIEVAGHRIAGGLLYFGQGLSSISGRSSNEPALINPVLAVDNANPDVAGEYLTYWPSYAEIRPQSRAAYLAWLAGGRTSKTNVGYGFLFLYGLERRVLVDYARAPAEEAERMAIVREIERLLGVFRDSKSFQGYASGLLAIARSVASPRRAYETPPVVAERGTEVPLSVAIALGQLAVDRRPLPAEWALAWLRAAPDVMLRTPATRCAAEFDALFTIRYREHFGDGLELKVGRGVASLVYHAASSSLGGQIPVPGRLPDVTRLAVPRTRLMTLADECCDELDGLSRWLGKNPAGRNTLAAVAHLPVPLMPTMGVAAAGPLREWMESHLAGRECTVVPASDLIRQWPGSNGDKLAKADCVAFAQLLARLGYGFEPDIRFGGPALAANAPAVIFRPSSAVAAVGSPAYASATKVLALAATIACADGVVSAEEEQHLERYVDALPDLTENERRRLAAHLNWLLAKKPTLTGLKKIGTTLDDRARTGLGEFLVSVAGIDGRIDPAEVKALTKIYPILGLDAANVPRDIHALATAGGATPAAPVGKREKAAAAASTKAQGAIELDMSKVESKLAETSAVASLLGSIFREEESEPPGPPPAAAGPKLRGLDGPHSEFVRALAAQPSWSRADLDALCTRLQLMPDGAIDAVNEAAYDTAGEPLCDGDDPVEINQTTLKEMLA